MSTAKEWIVVVVFCGLLSFSYHLLFSPFFPNADGTLGHDYSYFLPQLLDGYFWYHKNGLFVPQWFTPAFCGGLPALPNPQNIFYSVPQWLTFITDPLSAVYLSVVTFAILGFVGFYLLLRCAFRTSLITALLGATLFFFNGFYTNRMIIGHLTFQAFMLLPLMAFFLLRPAPPGESLRWRLATDVSLSALMLAYTVYSGMVNLLLPTILTLVAIGLVHGLCFGGARLFWLRLATAGGVSIALSASKLVASLAFLGHFERALYPLPGAGSVWGLLQMTFTSLFLVPSSEPGSGIIVNSQWSLGRHEFEYGITLIPLFIIVAGMASALKNWRSLLARNFSSRHWLAVSVLLVLLSIPLVVNFYTPDWNAVLKEIPLIRSSSNLLRWFCIYIPFVILTTALFLERSNWLGPVRLYVGGLALITVLASNVFVDRDYYAHQPYVPIQIGEAYARSQVANWSPGITHIQAFLDQEGNVFMPVSRNHTFITGGSQLACYEPIFGYRLERFPVWPLHPGAVTDVHDGVLNMKNPACYVFGKSNDCTPGIHFSAAQMQETEAFINYQPFKFKIPAWQYIANIVTLSAMTILFGIVASSVFRFIRETFCRRR